MGTLLAPILAETDRNNFNVKLRMIKLSIVVEGIIFWEKNISWHLYQSETKKNHFSSIFISSNFVSFVFFGIISTINSCNCFCLALSCFIFMFMSPRSFYCYFRGIAIVIIFFCFFIFLLLLLFFRRSVLWCVWYSSFFFFFMYFGHFKHCIDIILLNYLTWVMLMAHGSVFRVPYICMLFFGWIFFFNINSQTSLKYSLFVS